MSNKVLLKKSSVAAKVPLTTDLEYGELALNYADGKLFFKNASNVIKSFTIDDSVVTLTGTQTLTNKTLTTPLVDRIDWAAAGFAQPSFTTRSVGTKLLLYPALSGSLVDYSIGIDGGALWTTIPAANSTFSFKWYGGETQIASLSGDGNLIVTGSISSNGSTVATLTGTQTLTNKTIAAGSNTISGLTNTNLSGSAGITNANLANSSVTIGNTAVALGATVTTFTGLASVTSTAFVGALTGNASTATTLQNARTINGVSFNGSANITVAANTTNTLTIGTGLSGTSFNGSGAVTITIDSTVATLTGTQTLTNKTINLSSNTLVATSAQIAAAVTDETGSGVLVFGTAPTITLPTINNIRRGYSTTVTAAGTTTLTVNSNYLQFFTGTTTQILSLPAPQTMTLGMGFFVVNNSTGNIEVRASNAATVATVLAGTAVLFVSIDLTAGNGAAGWSAEIVGFSGVTGTGNAVLATSPTLVTPALGTPASGNLTNCTFPTLNQNTTGSAATLTTTRAINGVNFNGSAAITVPLNTTNRTTNETGHLIMTGTTATGNVPAYTNSGVRVNPSQGRVEANGLSAAAGLLEHANNITVTYSIKTGNNAVSAGPVTIDDSGSITIPDGSTWIIISPT